MPATPASAADRALYMLVLRCQAGDTSAFARLLELFGGRTLAHLRRLLGDDAEDVHQEVWLAVYRNLRGLANPGAFRTWLFQTTRHRAIDFLRTRKRQQELLEDSAYDLPTDAGAVDDAPSLDSSSVGAALQTLTPILREALLLHYDEGLSYDEIAVVVGCPIGTVRSRIHHAKRTLKQAMDHQEGAK